MLTPAQQYTKLQDEAFSILEYYARRHHMNGKALLVFLWIYHHPDGLTQETIAKHTYSTKQVVQAIVKTYMEKNIFYMEISSADRRKKLVKLTEAGKVFARQLIEPLNTSEEAAMSVLSEEEQQLLITLTEKYHQRLKTLLNTKEA